MIGVNNMLHIFGEFWSIFLSFNERVQGNTVSLTIYLNIKGDKTTFIDGK